MLCFSKTTGAPTTTTATSQLALAPPPTPAVINGDKVNLSSLDDKPAQASAPNSADDDEPGKDENRLRARDHLRALCNEADDVTGAAERPQKLSSSAAPTELEESLRGGEVGGGAVSDSKETSEEVNNMTPLASRLEEPTSTRKAPQRKLSVFSYDGFPNIQLLDQQNLKSRASAESSKQAEASDDQMGANKQQQQAKSRRSARSDTLGSTGSSRASSCDEPTIVAAGLSSDTKQSCSSSSSLESLGCWPAGEKKEMSETAGSSKKTIPPFESIKVQLERNSMPDAQIIQRHIDNLISQNEAIIDNCNLVSIRSYNQSTQSKQADYLAQTQAKRSLCEQQNEASNKVNMTGAAWQTKRWSTTVLPTQFGQTSALASDLKPRQQAERKRSYNLASQRSQTQAGPPKSLSINSASDLFNTRFANLPDMQALLNLTQSEDSRPQQAVIASDRLQLESAIENLSLKRKEDGIANNLNYIQSNSESHITTTSAAPCWNSNKSHNQLWPRHEAPATLTNLANTFQEQQQRDEQQQKIFMAALLMDQQQKHRNVTEEHERSAIAAAIFHRQQMIEQQQQQQLDQLRQLASIDCQKQQQLANAAAVHRHQILATSQTALMASIQHQQQQHEAAKQAQYSQPVIAQPLSLLRDQQVLEGQLLNDFLSQILPRTSNQQQNSTNLPSSFDHSHVRNLEHGGELLTQSLDSAIPAHRCNSCDIAFWTKDLLDYHKSTQCLANANLKQNNQPIAFSFGNSNINNNVFQSSQRHQLVSKSNPSAQLAFPDIILEQERLSRKQLQKQIPSLSSVSPTYIELLREQLLTHSTPSVNPLPFKKRKISEPNMRH